MANPNATKVAGKSIIDLLWEEMDHLMDLLMEDHCEEPEWTRGRATGVAWAIALMSNPYLQNVDQVRTLAKERWEQRMDGEEVTPLRTRP